MGSAGSHETRSRCSPLPWSPLSLALAACGDSGADSSSPEAERRRRASEERPAEEGPTESESRRRAARPAQSEKVEIVEFTYQPEPVAVQAGGKVIWQNEDAAPHTATADDGSFDTGTIEQGKIGSETFKEAGHLHLLLRVLPRDVIVEDGAPRLARRGSARTRRAERSRSHLSVASGDRNGARRRHPDSEEWEAPDEPLRATDAEARWSSATS